MKDHVNIYVALATILLLVLTIMATLNVPFDWLFYTFLLGQLAMLVMVYKVLTDNYITTKTFKDFYEDKPIKED